MVEILEYLDVNNNSAFAKWFEELNTPAALKVNTYLSRIETGNFSQVKSVGEGVYECRIDYGPGYRVYFGQASKALVILLGGGTKKRQQKDIEKAKVLWQEYKKRKKEV